MHLDSGDVQRLLHGELSADRRTALQAHLLTCGSCRANVEEAKREGEELEALLAVVDHPVPDVDAEILVSRSRRPRRQWVRWAAGLVLGLGISGVAYAAPGSPLPGWISRFTGILVDPLDAPPPEQLPPLGAGGGLAVDPGGGLLVEISGIVEGGTLRLELTSGTDLEAVGGLTPFSFTSEPGRLGIDGIGPDTLRIALPASAPSVEIRAEGRAVVVKEGVVVQGPDGELLGSGPFLIPLWSGPR